MNNNILKRRNFLEPKNLRFILLLILKWSCKFRMFDQLGLLVCLVNLLVLNSNRSWIVRGSFQKKIVFCVWYLWVSVSIRIFLWSKQQNDFLMNWGISSEDKKCRNFFEITFHCGADHLESLSSEEPLKEPLILPIKFYGSFIKKSTYVTLRISLCWPYKQIWIYFSDYHLKATGYSLIG